jgi:hypothetical protein
MSEQQTIPGPGVHTLTDDEYFAGPIARESLSSTGAREILQSPARFRYNQQYPRAPKRAFDVGHAAHQLVLGAGPELVEVPGTGKAGPNAWLSNADKDAVQAVRDRGGVPLKPVDFEAVHAMATAIHRHPHAPRLLSRGEPEKTLVWRDPATGVLCRAKTDWLRPDGIVDVKTCDKADDDSLSKALHNFGYAIQAAFYLRGFRAILRGHGEPGAEPFFAFIAVEKEPPYLPRVFQLTERALAWGDRKVSEALATYAACLEADDWPGYPTDEIPEIDLPAWVRTEEW